jgi:DNA-directed RNA polymerase subunit F
MTKSTEVLRNLALFRLASRELEGISASAEMFFSNAVQSGEGEKIRKLSNELSKIQEKADKLRAKLEKDLLPFENLEVNEIL